MAIALTTTDNPFNPFTHWESWLSYDEDAGHNTNQKLARVSNPSLDITDEEELAVLELEAIMFILEHDLTGLYMIVQDNAEE